MEHKILFREKQKFTQWWLWLLLIAIAAAAFFGVWKQLIQNEPLGSKPMSDLGLIIFASLMVALVILFWFLELRTSVHRKGIKMQFVPFVKKNVTWSEIKSAEVVNYGFVGGWGIRLGTKFGTVYNIKGKMGLAINLSDGKKFLIGTQKPEELQNVINQLKL